MPIKSSLLAAILALAGPAFAEPAEAPPEQPEARSLLGKPLFPPPIAAEKRQELEANLAKAQADLEASPDGEEAVIWVGRRLAYLHRYNDAVEIFTRGLREHPTSFKLLRHRGHRYLTLRMFDLAARDLQKAAQLIEGVPDQPEPDGQPNPAGAPLGTSHTNIFYHLGLACYLRGEFEPAAAAFGKCMTSAVNDDNRVSTTHWLYLTLRRLGRDDDAAALLKPISADMKIVENHGYHALTLFYKGERSAEDVMKGLEPGTPQHAAVAYGVGAFQLIQKRSDDAVSVFKQIVEGPMWPAFGHIAAEAELRRLRDTELGVDRENIDPRESTKRN